MIKTRYSPSALRAFNRCPRALDFYQERTAIDQAHFSVGSAFHEFYQSCGLATLRSRRKLNELDAAGVADATETRLLQIYPPQDVFDARRLFDKTLEAFPPLPDCLYEVGVAFTRDWELVEWDAPAARFRLVFDRIDLPTDPVEDEDGCAFTYLSATDFKTSWSAGVDDLNGLQMKAQLYALFRLVELKATLGKTTLDDVDFITVEIYNVRTGGRYPRQYFVGDPLSESRAEMLQLREEIEAVMDAADATLDPETDRRPARAGYSCAGCAYVLSCEDCFKAAALGVELGDRQGLARKYGAIEAARDELRKVLKNACDESSIDVDGATLGNQRSETRALELEGVMELWRAWRKDGGDAEGFLTTLGKVAVTEAKRVARVLNKGDKDAAENLIDSLATVKVGSTFGWRKKDGEK